MARAIREIRAQASDVKHLHHLHGGRSRKAEWSAFAQEPLAQCIFRPIHLRDLKDEDDLVTIGREAKVVVKLMGATIWWPSLSSMRTGSC